jgi:hypothetical protein
MVSATNSLYWGFHSIHSRRHGLGSLYDNGFFSEDLGSFFLIPCTRCTPILEGKFSSKSAAYTRANTVFMYEDDCLLACCAVSSGRSLPTFRKCVEAASTSETSVNFYQSTRRNIPEDSHLHTCRRENLKSHLYLCSLFNDLE